MWVCWVTIVVATGPLHDCCALVLESGTMCHPFPPKLSLTLAENELPLLRLHMKTPCFSDDFLEHDKLNMLQYGAPPEMLEDFQHSVSREAPDIPSERLKGVQKVFPPQGGDVKLVSRARLVSVDLRFERRPFLGNCVLGTAECMSDRPQVDPSWACVFPSWRSAGRCRAHFH